VAHPHHFFIGTCRTSSQIFPHKQKTKGQKGKETGWCGQMAPGKSSFCSKTSLALCYYFYCVDFCCRRELQRVSQAIFRQRFSTNFRNSREYIPRRREQ